MITKYCKCEHCGEFFEIDKARKYCTRKCLNAAYYIRRTT